MFNFLCSANIKCILGSIAMANNASQRQYLPSLVCMRNTIITQFEWRLSIERRIWSVRYWNLIISIPCNSESRMKSSHSSVVAHGLAPSHCRVPWYNYPPRSTFPRLRVSPALRAPLRGPELESALPHYYSLILFFLRGGNAYALPSPLTSQG